jgi:hypothetical protein
MPVEEEIPPHFLPDSHAATFTGANLDTFPELKQKIFPSPV